MDLIKDIELRISTLLVSDILLSPGVERADDYITHENIAYSENTFIPIQRWRKAEEFKNYEALFCSQSQYNLIVSVKKLPNHLIELFDSLELTGDYQRRLVINKFYENKETTKLISQNLNQLFRKISFGPFEYLNLGVGNIGLMTTSKYFDTPEATSMKYLGLHMDRSISGDLKSAGNSRNRLAINLGVETRRLLFVNLSINKLISLLTGKGVKTENITSDNIASCFFNYFPNYPIISISIPPYHYYIAPTDNCLHDGQTLHMKNVDIVMSFVGYFNHD